MIKTCEIILVLLALGLGCFLVSCSTEIDVYTDYSPIPNVFCHIDPTDSFCFVTVSKSFQSNIDVHEVLINRKDLLLDNAEITLEVWGEGYKAWETSFSLIAPIAVNSIRSINSRSVYKSDKALGFKDPLVSGAWTPWIYEDLRLIVTSPEFEEIIYSKVPIINAPKIWYPTYPFGLNLYGDDNSFFLFKVDADLIKHANLICDFYYKEFTDQWTDRIAQMMLKINIPIMKDTLSIRLFEEAFFNKLIKEINTNSDVAARLFGHMNFTFLVSDVFFDDYYSTYKGLGDNDHGYYTNIMNGMGLFSVKRKVVIPNMFFDRMTFDSLVYGRLTKHLNFRDW